MEELDNLAKLLPVEKREEFYKLITTTGLRQDDHLMAFLYVMGYVRTMYQDIPSIIDELNENIKDIKNSASEKIKEKVHALFLEETARLEKLLLKQAETALAIEDAAEHYQEQSRVNLENINQETELLRARMANNLVNSLHLQVPVVVKETLGEFTEGIRSEQKSLFVKVGLIMFFASMVGGFIGALLSGLLFK